MIDALSKPLICFHCFVRQELLLSRVFDVMNSLLLAYISPTINKVGLTINDTQSLCWYMVCFDLNYCTLKGVSESLFNDASTAKGH